jgi:tight adherence protein B
MNELLFPILIALAAAMAVWGVARVLVDRASGEKRKLAARLSNENRLETPSLDSTFGTIIREVPVLGVPQWMARLAFIQALHRHLLQTFPHTTLPRFMAISALLGVAAAGVAFAIGDSVMVASAGGLLAAYLPLFYLRQKRVLRQRQLTSQLPDALDFLSRVLKAGHSFSTGLQMMADELPEPLAAEMRQCYDAHSLGQPLDQALKETAARIESSDFAFFVTALVVQRQTGGDLSEVLRNISAMIRARLRLAQHVKAKTAEGRLTGYILVAFPAAMFLLCYVQNPAYCGKLLEGTGRYFLALAFLLQMLGLWSIRMITTVKV